MTEHTLYATSSSDTRLRRAIGTRVIVKPLRGGLTLLALLAAASCVLADPGDGRWAAAIVAAGVAALSIGLYVLETQLFTRMLDAWEGAPGPQIDPVDNSIYRRQVTSLRDGGTLVIQQTMLESVLRQLLPAITSVAAVLTATAMPMLPNFGVSVVALGAGLLLLVVYPLYLLQTLFLASHERRMHLDGAPSLVLCALWMLVSAVFALIGWLTVTSDAVLVFSLVVAVVTAGVVGLVWAPVKLAELWGRVVREDRGNAPRTAT